MKIALAIVLVALFGFDAHAQTLPGGQPRGLLTYDGDLKEARLKSEPALPPWLARCDPPFYEVFNLRVAPAARVLLAVFIGGNAHEEVITYTLIPQTATSCAAIGSLDSFTFRRAAQLRKGEYSEIFPVLNAKDEIRYLLHEEKSLSATPGSASLTRTLLALTEKSLKQTARIRKADVDAAQPANTTVPFAALLK